MSISKKVIAIACTAFLTISVFGIAANTASAQNTATTGSAVTAQQKMDQMKQEIANIRDQIKQLSQAFSQGLKLAKTAICGNFKCDTGETTANCPSDCIAADCSTSKNCSSLGYVCGYPDGGCGKPLNCGKCEVGKTCVAGACQVAQIGADGKECITIPSCPSGYMMCVGNACRIYCAGKDSGYYPNWMKTSTSSQNGASTFCGTPMGPNNQNASSSDENVTIQGQSAIYGTPGTLNNDPIRQRVLSIQTMINNLRSALPSVGRK